MLILASESPRRKELLTQLTTYIATASTYEETAPKKEKPKRFVLKQACGKACEVAKTYPDQWVLGADTIVVLDGKILGKPKDAAQAVKMLKALSGRQHSVYTGLALVCGKTVKTKVVKTDVWFRKLTVKEITGYVESGEPLDKAGAYGIQGGAASFVTKLNGSYTNVVGLPLAQLQTMLKKAKVLL